MTTRRVFALVPVALLAAAVELGRGLVIPAKAAAAQLLLRTAWARARSGAERARPWPWADTWPVARLRARRQSVDLVVLAGASGAALAFAPGHVDGTAPPCGPGNCVLAGHRDTTFAFLRRLAPGDPLELQAPDGEVHAYRVAALRVVRKEDGWVLGPAAEERLTLVTCYPFSSPVAGGPLRFVVWADREPGPGRP